jgi:Tfp pilus assembly protein PilF
MKKLLLAVLAMLFCCAPGIAQEQPAAPHTKVLPMFGNKPKTEAEQKADEKFLSSCDKSFSSRTEASEFFMNSGWGYFNEGQVDTAMYRFNLAWLLNPDNYNTYWAFGLVENGKGNTAEAIGMYERALKYQPNNSLLLSDMAAAYLTQYEKDKKKKTLKKVVSYLDQSLAADARNAYALFTMSQVRYHEKKYAEAWDYLHQSRHIDMRTLNYEFLAELIAQMPDPQGMFRGDNQ